MRRGSGYAGPAQRHRGWDGDGPSDHHQDDDVHPPLDRFGRPGYDESYNTTVHNRPPQSRDRPSGIPRPGGSTSRPHSALKPPRIRSYNSSSADSRGANGNVPPIPQIPCPQGRSGVPEVRTDFHDTTNDYSHSRPQSGLSRRPSCISRPRSRSYSGSDSVDVENPPPLPGSNCDGNDTETTEQTPKRASWAKDRRRFANATPTSTTGAFVNRDRDLLSTGHRRRHDHPPTPVAATRRSSLKTPSNFRNSITPTAITPPAPSRIPLVPTKSGRDMAKPRQSLEQDIDSRNSSRTNYSIGNGDDQTLLYAEDRKTPQAAPSRVRASRATDPPRSEPLKQLPLELDSTPGTNSRPRNRRSSVQPKADSNEARRKSELVLISSMHDTQLPVSPFAQPSTMTGDHTPRRDGTGGSEWHETISSPVETMLIGCAPALQGSKAPNSGRMSTPARQTRESSVDVSSPMTSSALGNRRLSEPSPNKSTPSAKAQPPTAQEPTPTILQRIARRASFSTGKSPKATNTPQSLNPSDTPKNRLDVKHNAKESPFDLELDTPRVTITSGRDMGANGGASGAHQDVWGRQENRQSSIYQSTVYLGSTGNEPRKLRSKAVEDISGGSEERLGSPFMGDGSPRFGIDERFRSPKKRSKSSLRHNTFESDDDRSQELLDYYGHGVVEPVNTANYYIEGLPIGTVLSSPGSTPVDNTPKGTTPSSPIAQSKKRSQYPYAGRTRPSLTGSNTTQKGSGDSDQTLNDDSDSCIPTARPQSRSPSFVPPPIITRTSVTSLDTYTHSEFSDYSDQEPDEQEYLRVDVLEDGTGLGKGNSGRRASTSVRFASETRQNEGNQQASQGGDSPRGQTGHYKSGVQSLRTTSGQHGIRVSQLPVPRQRKTNSALFRALEQPYDSSSSATVASLGSSSVSEGPNSSNEAKTGSDYATTGASMEGLHAVSSISSSLDGNGVGGIRWSGAQELSGAAEALFHNIGQSHSGQNVQLMATDLRGRSMSSTTDGSTYDMDETDDGDYDSSRNSSLRNSERPHHEDHEKQGRMSMQDKRRAIHESWRASLEEGQFQRLEETYDPMEMRRQELIWEFHESERTFVDSLRILVHLFVQPLRTQDQRHWIAGLSSDVMRLFDWLDDITNLHEQLLDALEALRQDHEQVIILFSEAIQPFIPLMELYQPYVVRAERTNEQIASMALDPQSDFGEFVRMKSALPECELSLEEMTRRPLSRLREYVSFFHTLLTFTPRTHPDHLSCFSLLHSMHATMAVLDEVKAREEEHELIKRLLSRVHGLPPQFAAARRENRLLAQGPLTRVYIHGDEQPGGKATLASRKSSTFMNRETRARSSSQSTATSSTTTSTTSYRSTSSSTTHLKNSPTEYSMRSDSSATSGANTPHDSRGNSKIASVNRTQMTGLRTPRPRCQTPSTSQVEEAEVYALVFTEYIVLAKAVMGNRGPRSPWRDPNEKWTTLETLGVFQLLGVVDYRGRYGYEYLISLDLAPIGDTSLEEIDSPVFVDIPYQAQEPRGDTQDPQKARQQWFRSLQQCHLHMLRSISFPSHPDNSSPDMNLSVSSLSVEDRFPKSPSQQIKRGVQRNKAKLPPVSNVEEEREEREFWAARFKTVSKEMKRAYEGISRSNAPEAPVAKPPRPSRVGRFRSSGTFI